MAPEKTQSVLIHAVGPQIHPLDCHPVHEIYSWKSQLRSENTLKKYLSCGWQLPLMFHQDKWSSVNNAVQHIVKAAVV